MSGLFTELFVSLKSNSGRAGVIVPVGIATNETTSPFFASLIEGNLLTSLYAFSEIKAWFSGTKDNQSFCLLTLGASKEAEFSFQIKDWSDLDDPRRRFKLQTETVLAMNPNTSTAPVFRSRADAEITAKIYASAPVLINETQGTQGDPWRMNFARLFDMANDSTLFKTSAELSAYGFMQKGNEWFAAAQDLSLRDKNAATTGEPTEADYLPLFEAKMINFYDHRWGYYPDGATDDTRALPRPTLSDKCNVMFEVNSRYWVKREDVEARLARKEWNRKWLIGWRDVTNITNERTLIAGCVPLVGTGDKFLLSLPDQHPSLCAGLLANFSALPTDFAARQKLGGTSLKYFTMKQLPIFSPEFYSESRLAFIVPKVLELTYTSLSLAPFARDLGHDGPPFAWDEERRANLRADLDAFYARAYDLTRDELRYILDPADVKGADYPSETFRVLKEKEIRQHGEYRTQRLVLAAWDRLEADGTFRELGLASVPAANLIPVSIELPPLGSLPNGAWSWPTNVQPHDRLRYAAQYALWLMNPADDGDHARFLVASLAEPALLTPMLTGSDRDQWIRLVGPETQSGSGVVRLRPAINAVWRSMFETLITSGQLAEAGDGAWTLGQHFNPSGLQAHSADAQRTAFAIHAIRGINIERLTAAVAQEDNVVWARFGHAG